MPPQPPLTAPVATTTSDDVHNLPFKYIVANGEILELARSQIDYKNEKQFEYIDMTETKKKAQDIIADLEHKLAKTSREESKKMITEAINDTKNTIISLHNGVDLSLMANCTTIIARLSTAHGDAPLPMTLISEHTLRKHLIQGVDILVHPRCYTSEYRVLVSSCPFRRTRHRIIQHIDNRENHGVYIEGMLDSDVINKLVKQSSPFTQYPTVCTADKQHRYYRLHCNDDHIDASLVLCLSMMNETEYDDDDAIVLNVARPYDMLCEFSANHRDDNMTLIVYNNCRRIVGGDGDCTGDANHLITLFRSNLCRISDRPFVKLTEKNANIVLPSSRAYFSILNILCVRMK